MFRQSLRVSSRCGVAHVHRLRYIIDLPSWPHNPSQKASQEKEPIDTDRYSIHGFHSFCLNRSVRACLKGKLRTQKVGLLLWNFAISKWKRAAHFRFVSQQCIKAVSFKLPQNWLNSKLIFTGNPDIWNRSLFPLIVVSNSLTYTHFLMGKTSPKWWCAQDLLMDDHVWQHHLPVLASSFHGKASACRRLWKLNHGRHNESHHLGVRDGTSWFGAAGEGGLGEMKWASSLEQLACPNSAWWQQDIDR